MDNGTQIGYTWFRQDVELAHPAGYVIEYQPAVSDRGWLRWFADLDGARAELARIAAEVGRPLTADGTYLNVTARDCNESRYFIRPTPGRATDWRSP